MRRVQIRSVTLICIAALLAAGCGGGGGGKSASSAPQNSAPPPSSNPPPSSTPPPSSGTNSAPTIQGAPAGAVLAGQSYSFQPAASDSDGDALTFTATNVPAWATFNASTGRISGTPTAAQVATYNNVTISVSDGKATASLAPFAITVSDVVTGSATLSWVPPTQNQDGSALTNLAGYEVQYGRSAGSLDQKVVLSNPSISSYVVGNLSSGTWYFAVVAVNQSGIVSSPSDVASKTIS